MKKHISFSLSIQREIEEHGLNVESEVNKSFNELGIRTFLHQSRIRKEKGFPPITLLFNEVLGTVYRTLLFTLTSATQITFNDGQVEIFSEPVSSARQSIYIMVHTQLWAYHSCNPKRRKYTMMIISRQVMQTLVWTDNNIIVLGLKFTN